MGYSRTNVEISTSQFGLKFTLSGHITKQFVNIDRIHFLQINGYGPSRPKNMYPVAVFYSKMQICTLCHITVLSFSFSLAVSRPLNRLTHLRFFPTIQIGLSLRSLSPLIGKTTKLIRVLQAGLTVAGTVIFLCRKYSDRKISTKIAASVDETDAAVQVVVS